MPLLILNLSCENVKYPARKHFEMTNNYWSFQNVFALDISHFHSSNSKSIRA